MVFGRDVLGQRLCLISDSAVVNSFLAVQVPSVEWKLYSNREELVLNEIGQVLACQQLDASLMKVKSWKRFSIEKGKMLLVCNLVFCQSCLLYGGGALVA